MSKLPVVQGKQIIQVLKKLDFEESSERGSSHLVFKHKDGRRTVVSRHPGKDMPRGTLRAILREIEISPDQFTEILKQV